MRAGYSNVTLKDEEIQDLIAIAQRVAGPVVKIEKAPEAIRTLIRLAKGFTIENARKYAEAVDKMKEEGKHE